MASPQPPIPEPIRHYLAQVAEGLWGILPHQRSSFIRELQANLLDEMEDLEIPETSCETFVAGLEAPHCVASAFRAGEWAQGLDRSCSALITGLTAWFSFLSYHFVSTPAWNGPSWIPIGSRFALVIVIIALLRPIWSRASLPLRLGCGLLSGGLCGGILGTVLFGAGNVSLAITGAFTGWALERVEDGRQLPFLPVEAGVYAWLLWAWWQYRPAFGHLIALRPPVGFVHTAIIHALALAIGILIGTRLGMGLRRGTYTLSRF